MPSSRPARSASRRSGYWRSSWPRRLPLPLRGHRRDRPGRGQRRVPRSALTSGAPTEGARRASVRGLPVRVEGELAAPSTICRSGRHDGRSLCHAAAVDQRDPTRCAELRTTAERRQEREGNDGAIQATVLGRCRGGDRRRRTVGVPSARERRRPSRRTRSSGSSPSCRARSRSRSWPPRRRTAPAAGVLALRRAALHRQRVQDLRAGRGAPPGRLAGGAAEDTQQQLALDASVWSLDSATFNPPNLSGTVPERTASKR